MRALGISFALSFVFSTTLFSSETNLEAGILAFRKSLADPKKFELRQDLVVQQGPLVEALSNFRREHLVELDTRLARSFSNMRPGKAPRTPAYKMRVSVETNRFAEMSDMLRGMSTLYPDAEKLSKFLLNVVFPMSAVREVGMSTASAGAWLSFFNTAEPEFLLYSRTPNRIETGLDYGGLDVVTVEWGRREGSWLPNSVTWWQRVRR